MQKKVINLFTLIGMAALIIYLVTLLPVESKDGINIHFFDVGQGDSIYVEMPKGQNLLIDGGPDASSEKSLNREQPFYKREIQNLVLTHPHADHYGGLINIAKNYKIDNFYYSGSVSDNSQYSELMKLLSNRKVNMRKVRAGDQLQFPEGITLKFLSPKDSNAENINNDSVVSELIWGSKRALFMGDLEENAQANLSLEDIDLLKVSHHCSSNAISPDFIRKVSPEYAVISIGRHNDYGHPADKCLNYLKSTKVYRTDQDGEIEFSMTKDSISELKKSRF